MKTARGVMRPLITVAASTLLCVACATSDDAPEDPFAGPAWFTEGPEVRIGAVDDAEYSFSTVATMALGPDGYLYSLHRGEGSARRWTMGGEPAGTVGREGDGPGEFQRPGRIGFFGDTLWIMDSYAYRVSLFELDGTYMDRLTPEVDIGSAEGSPPRPESPLRDGTFLGRAPAWSQEIATGELVSTPWVHMNADGSTLSPMWDHPHQTWDILALLNEDGSGGSFGAQPFGDAALVKSVDDGLVMVDRRVWSGEGAATLHVTRIGVSGDTVLSVEVEYAPEPLPMERVDSATRVSAKRMHSFLSRNDPGLALGALERDMREATFAPAHLPPVRDFIVANDGSIWLQRFEPLETETGERLTEWWVLSSSGEAMGRALTPAGLTIHIIDVESIWGVEMDDFDVNYIVRYRLVRDT
jgi:hypothetical protein